MAPLINANDLKKIIDKKNKNTYKHDDTGSLQQKIGVTLSSIFLLPWIFPTYFRNKIYGLISSCLCTGIYLYHKFRPPTRTALMDLASQINDDKPSPELQKRIDRINYLKSIAGPPLTPKEELNLLDVTPSPRFTYDDPEMVKYLDEYGYVVVNLQTSTSTLNELKNKLWNYLEKNFIGWKRNCPETWKNDTVPNIWSPDKGIIFGNGIGHSDFLWSIRALSGVKESFAKIWNDDDLLTSFDGGNIFRPWNVKKDIADSANDNETTKLSSMYSSWKTSGGWWHVDQGSGKLGRRHAVQGLFSLYGANASTGGLCVMPKSQSRHDEVCQDSVSSRDYVSVQPYLPGYATMHRKLVCCEPGDLILWDSRTIHCNTPAHEPLQDHDPNELLRAVGYVCMTPRSMATPEVLAMRKEAYNYEVTTSHWPHVYHPGQANDNPTNDYNTCSEERKKLI
jgi:hypothetical protein